MRSTETLASAPGVRARLAVLEKVNVDTVELWFTRLMICAGISDLGCGHTIRLSFFSDAPVAVCPICGQPYWRQGEVATRDVLYRPGEREVADIRLYWRSLRQLALTGELASTSSELTTDGRIRTHCKKGPWCRAGDHWHA